MYPTLNNTIALIATLLALIFLFNKRIRNLSSWHAIVTPLASIIGSGFLVSAPLLLLTTGPWSVLAMTAIVLLAYALGASLRFNIQYVEPLSDSPTTSLWLNKVEMISRPILGIAYIISVAFYLKLLSAFVLQGFMPQDPIYQNMLTTVILLFIGIVGKIRGLSTLERLETYSVSVKLAIIFSLIITHFFYNTELLSSGQWTWQVHANESWWLTLRKLLGMLIIIQGFETSRYIRHAYRPETRIKTMRYAQLISGVIYIVFVALVTIDFHNLTQANPTSIIELCRIAAPILPVLLVVASVMSQFSAAVADTVGSGGLLSEASHQKVTVNSGYFFISLTAIALTWLTNIYEIVTIASKAFAIYYALQLCLTLIKLKQDQSIHSRTPLILFYTLLLALMILVITLGIPVE